MMFLWKNEGKHSGKFIDKIIYQQSINKYTWLAYCGIVIKRNKVRLNDVAKFSSLSLNTQTSIHCHPKPDNYTQCWGEEHICYLLTFPLLGQLNSASPPMGPCCIRARKWLLFASEENSGQLGLLVFQESSKNVI